MSVQCTHSLNVVFTNVVSLSHRDSLLSDVCQSYFNLIINKYSSTIVLYLNLIINKYSSTIVLHFNLVYKTGLK